MESSIGLFLRQRKGQELRQITKGFDTREGNFKLSTMFGCGQFAAEGLAADSALANVRCVWRLQRRLSKKW
jgi:hypothetical protein